jgi:uronate dehydrogenase
LITGSAGTIGRILVSDLAHEVTEFDLPERDARALEQLVDAATGHDALVHLAWNTTSEHSGNRNIDFDNALMAFNAYRACEQTSVRRVVMASSVHADAPSRPSDGLRVASAVPTPDSPYGASKVFVEALGRYYADRGLEVMVVRFGGVDRRASDRDFGIRAGPHAWWLSHADCVALVDACLRAPVVPGRYTAFYGVSDNPGRVHDTTNPFGWIPERQARPGPLVALGRGVVRRRRSWRSGRGATDDFITWRRRRS